MGEDSGALVATTAFAAGALYLSWYLAKGSGDLKTFDVAEQEGPSTQTSRGAYIPYVIGRGRVGVLYAWTGNRGTQLVARGGAASSSSSSVTKGKKKKRTGGGPTSFATHYYEDAFLPVCIGKATELVDIFFAGKSVLVGEQQPPPTFTDTSHPSGTALPTGNSKGVLSSAVIFWGELDQAGDSVLTSPTAGMGIASRWPGLTYFRMRALLGEVPRWPLMDIEIMTPIQDTGSVTLGLSTPEIVSATYTDGRKGLNGAHILAQLLFGSDPYGLSLDPALFDIPSLEVLGSTLESEGILSAVVAKGGESYKALIGALMQELGCMISWDQAIGKWRFVTIRLPGTIPTIPSDMVQTRPIETQVRHTGQQSERVTFRFFDVDERYRAMTVTVGSDHAVLGGETIRTKTIQLKTTVDHQSASVISERRSQEALGKEARYRMVLDRNAAALYPGRQFFVQGIPVRLLVRTARLDVLSGKVEITAMEDSIGVSPSKFFLNKPPEGPPLIRPVKSDVSKIIVEVPLFMLGASDPPSILVPRIRNNDQVTRADFHLSDDNISYSLLGSTNTLQTGGVLASALPTGDPILTSGPDVTLLGPPDDNLLEDFTAKPTEWRSGEQVVVIGEEIMFVRNLVPVGGGKWRMDGIIRARMGTTQGSHSINDDVFVFGPREVFSGSDAIMVSTNEIWIKTQPASLGGVTDLALESPVSRILYMTGHRPLPPINLRVTGQINVFTSGQDVRLDWSYKSRGGGQMVHGNNGSGSGMSNGGQPVADAPPEGDSFILRFYKDPTGVNTLVRTEIVTPIANGQQSFTYTNANLVADLSSEQDFAVELTEQGNGYESTPALRIIVEFK